MANSDPGSSPERLRERLAELREEFRRTESALAEAESGGELKLDTIDEIRETDAPTTAAEKLELFQKLFVARRSVFPKLWVNVKTGKKGYAPACDNEWKPGICRKPQVKCADCLHKKFPPLDARMIEAHLRGVLTAGTYAIREDDSCVFLAADFDGDGWREEVAAYRDTGERCGVTVAVERSRSGDGAHAWIFFAEPVPAATARRLGTLLLAKTSAMRPTLPMSAYDRLFPNQDTMPAGGFGNLIALPLAKTPRSQGNTVFLDTALNPHADQWAHLAGLPRLSRAGLEQILGLISPLPPLNTAGPESPEAAFSDEPVEPFALKSDEAALDLSHGVIHPGLFTGEVTVRLDAAVNIPRTLPTALLGALRRLATLPNPVFYEKQRMRFPTYDTPRMLFAGEWRADRLVLPRALLASALALIEKAGGAVAVQDAREAPERIAWKFTGELRPAQAVAVRELARHECGVLCAPPGAGKTVMGCALAARAKLPVLVLVHRAVLVDQWRAAAMKFLGLKRKEVGVIRRKSGRRTGCFDIAMLPSLAAMENAASAFTGYGMVIVDECHHVPAVSFEAVLKAYSGPRIYGLTATPARKDRLEKLMFMQCGPVRYTMPPEVSELPRTVFLRDTTITLPLGAPANPAIHETWDALVADPRRRDRIVDDIIVVLAEGRSPLVLADRTAYLDTMEARLAERSPGTPRLRLAGAMGKKARAAVLSEIESHYAAGTPFALFATSSLVGEGFDLPRLDTLFLTMPLSFKGRLIQYAGRLHRAHEDKSEVRVYDYLDANLALTRSMFRKRLTGYRQMGYAVRTDGDTREPELFDS